MEREPILNVHLVANKQGLETVKPSIGMFNNRAPSVKLFVKISSAYRRLIGRSGVARNVASISRRAQASRKFWASNGCGRPSAISIEKQALKINLGRLQQEAQFLKKLLNLKQVVRGRPCDDYRLVEWRKPASNPYYRPRTNSSLS